VSTSFVKNQRKVRPRHTPWCMPSSVARSCASVRTFASRFPLPLALRCGSSWSIVASTFTPGPFNCMPSETAPVADVKPRGADHLTTPRRRIGDCGANGRRLGQPSRRLLRGHRPLSRWFPRRIVAWARVGVHWAGYSRAARRGLRSRPRRPSDGMDGSEAPC
jgi:hypothetical protein